MEQLARRDHRVSRVLQASQGKEGFLVTKAGLDSPVPVGQRARRVLLDSRDHRGALVPLDLEDLLVQRVRPAVKDLVDSRVMLDHRVLQAFKDLLETLASQENRGHRVSLAQ